MNLDEHLEALQASLLGPEPSDEALAVIGDPARLRVYRSMVRTRLNDIAANAFSRTRHALGTEAFQGIVDAYLEGGGPRTRYFWRIPLELFEVLVVSIPDGAPSHARDLARFEATRWRLRHEELPPSCAVTTLSFERRPVLHPAHALLSVAHRVDLRGEEHLAEARELCLYRGTDHKVTILVLNPVSHALLTEWRSSDVSLAESVKRVAERRHIQITEGFLAGLSALLENLLDRGLLLGSASD